MATTETNHYARESKGFPQEVRRLTETGRYPDFKGDLQAENIWLLGQVIHFQQVCTFQSERLRLRADLAEAEQELSLLHAQTSRRLELRVTELEAMAARVIANAGTAKAAEVNNRALMILGARPDAVPAGVAPSGAAKMTEEEHNAYPKGRW